MDYFVINTNQSGNYGTSAACPNLEARAYWNVCQPTSTTFYWNNIHAALDAAAITGGVVGLIVVSGLQTPSWVMSNVYNKVQDTNGNWYPAPWAVNYQSSWESFVSALYTEFGDSAFDHIICPQFCGATADTSLDNISGVSLSDWHSVGYTTTNAYNAFKNGVDYVRSLFTNTRVVVAWPPVGGGLSFDTTNGAITMASMETYFEGLSGNIGDMNEGLTDSWYRPFPSGMYVIYQEAGLHSNQTDFNSMRSEAVAGGASQLQVYKQDVQYV